MVITVLPLLLGPDGDIPEGEGEEQSKKFKGIRKMIFHAN